MFSEDSKQEIGHDKSPGQSYHNRETPGLSETLFGSLVTAFWLLYRIE